MSTILVARMYWCYRFKKMKVGDELRCSIMAGETHERAQVRVASASSAWTAKKKTWRFVTQQRAKYIRVIRTA